MSLLLGREAQNPIPQPDGHLREHRCWWCASNALLDQAARNEFAQTTAWVEQVIGRGAPSAHTPEVWARSLLAVLGLEVEPARGDVIDGSRATNLGVGAVVIGAPGVDAAALTHCREGWHPTRPIRGADYEVLRLAQDQETEKRT